MSLHLKNKTKAVCPFCKTEMKFMHANKEKGLYYYACVEKHCSLATMCIIEIESVFNRKKKAD